MNGYYKSLADPVNTVHYDYGEHNGIYNSQGLRSIVQLKESQHKALYIKFIEEANEILTRVIRFHTRSTILPTCAFEAR